VCDGVRTGAQLSKDKTSQGSTFEDFVASEFKQIVALAVAVLRNDEEALDVAQETMTRTYAAWSDVGDMDRPGAWARRVALNLITDVLRRRTRRKRLHLRLVREKQVTAINPSVESLDDAFWGEVAALPRRQRDAIALFYVHDLGIAEIASIVGVAEGTVKSDLSRARKRLQETFRSDE